MRDAAREVVRVLREELVEHHRAPGRQGLRQARRACGKHVGLRFRIGSPRKSSESVSESDATYQLDHLHAERVAPCAGQDIRSAVVNYQDEN